MRDERLALKDGRTVLNLFLVLGGLDRSDSYLYRQIRKPTIHHKMNLQNDLASELVKWINMDDVLSDRRANFCQRVCNFQHVRNELETAVSVVK